MVRGASHVHDLLADAEPLVGIWHHEVSLVHTCLLRSVELSHGFNQRWYFSWLQLAPRSLRSLLGSGLEVACCSCAELDVKPRAAWEGPTSFRGRMIVLPVHEKFGIRMSITWMTAGKQTEFSFTRACINWNHESMCIFAMKRTFETCNHESMYNLGKQTWKMTGRGTTKRKNLTASDGSDSFEC